LRFLLLLQNIDIGCDEMKSINIYSGDKHSKSCPPCTNAHPCNLEASYWVKCLYFHNDCCEYFEIYQEKSW